MIHTIFAVLVITSGLIIAVEPEIIIEDVLPDLHLCSTIHWYKEKCIKNSIISMKEYLNRGVPDLKIQKFEPYQAENLEIILVNNFEGSMTFSNTTMKDLTNFLVENVELSTNLDQFKFDIYFPLITMASTYTIVGKTLETSMKKTYRISGDLIDITANITIYGNFFWRKEDGEKFFRVNHVSTKLNVGDIKIDLKDTIKDKILPQYRIYYAKHLLKEAEPDILYKIERIASSTILDIANKIYLTFPIGKLMPVLC
ncbi:uncharacterized protein LOC116848915 [Odontomachus brunneus]|uniref:uncharacterized protein LOC116848915 n=1 Tax=Odontomachus brunneus TaxID=486640 RepID=UPI0013F22E9B|nr:uncharacterized protein LOC116848915 [Odontomachus brunneus]